jgi:hypothetical protein
MPPPPPPKKEVRVAIVYILYENAQPIVEFT